MDFNPDKTFFWSDTHFRHRGILTHCKRTRGNLEDVNAMDSWLREMWLFAVPRDGVLIHLGDFSFGKLEQSMKLINSMPGKFVFVRGNHDGKLRQQEQTDKFVPLGDLAEITVAGQRIVLCHFPLESWHGMHKGAWHLHGHCHGSLGLFGKRVDVGVDGPLGPAPISFRALQAWMAPRQIFSRDHHQPKAPE